MDMNSTTGEKRPEALRQVMEKKKDEAEQQALYNMWLYSTLAIFLAVVTL